MSNPEQDDATLARRAFAAGLHPNPLVRTVFDAERAIAEDLTAARAAAARAQLAVTCLELALHYCRKSQEAVSDSPYLRRT